MDKIGKSGRVLVLWALSGWFVAAADSTTAYCETHPVLEGRAAAPGPCTFSQRQGWISIRLADGVVHELEPLDGQPGRFRDGNGQTVHRQHGLGDQGLIFRFAERSLYVYWHAAARRSLDGRNGSEPFSTDDYDATTRLRCKSVEAREFGQCPAGILRMAGKQASIVILNPRGEIFTVNFLGEVINATNRQVRARLEGDTWILTLDDGLVYEVPLAAIEGG